MLLGEFDTGDNIFVLYNDGSYEVTDMDVQQRFEPKEILQVCKFTPELIVSAVHFDGHKGWTMVKRFHIETNKLKERFSFLTDHSKSKILFCSLKENPRIKYTIKIKGKPMTGEVSIGEFMDVKGWKAVGNRLSDQLLSGIKEVETPGTTPAPAAEHKNAPQQASLFGADAPEETDAPPPEPGEKKTFKAGDTIEFD